MPYSALFLKIKDTKLLCRYRTAQERPVFPKHNEHPYMRQIQVLKYKSRYAWIYG